MAIPEDEKYLMFFLNEENYGIPILKVNEIIGLMEITPMPRTTNFMKGVINLRGKIIPIIDLRLKFGMSEKVHDEQTCIIITEILIQGQNKFIGIVVDKVAEVVNVYESDIDMPPQYGQEYEDNFLLGIGKVKGKVIMLLDIETILNCQEMINLMKKELKQETEKLQTAKIA